jgi:hypothetical protein
LDDDAAQGQTNFEIDEQKGVGDEVAFGYDKNSQSKSLMNSMVAKIELFCVHKGKVIMLVSATNLDSAVGPDYREMIIKSYELHFE